MITVHRLKFSDDRKRLEINLETSIGHLFTSLKVWTDNKYGNDPTAIDLSSEYLNLSNKEVLSLSPTDMGQQNFEGLYFLEFKTNGSPELSDCFNCSGIQRIEMVVDTYPYEECLLKGTLQHLHKKDDRNTLLEIDFLLTSLNNSVKNDWFDQAIQLSESLDKYCDVCVPCNQLPSQIKRGFAGGEFKTGLKLS